jgi:methionine sulfoxide reductase heme-binding subunit
MFYKLGFQIEVLQNYSKTLFKLSSGYFGLFPSDPIKFISDITGITALQFLIVTLAVTPLKKVTTINLQKQRRLFGLISFFYAFLHMFLYLLLDHELNLISLLEEAVDKWFIFFGMASLLILLFLTLTSTKKGFAKYIKWHQLIYLAAFFISLHYLLSQKIVTLTPILYVSIVLILLLTRYKKIRL